MILRLSDSSPMFPHVPIRPDPHRRTNDAHGLLTVHRFLAIRVIGGEYFFAQIRKERKGQLVFARKTVMRVGTVGGNAQHDRVLLLHFLPQIAESLSLLGAAGSVVLR